MLKVSILTNKKVLFLKKMWSVPCTMDSSLFSQQMPYCLATLLVYMALVASITSEIFQRWFERRTTKACVHMVGTKKISGVSSLRFSTPLRLKNLLARLCAFVRHPHSGSKWLKPAKNINSLEAISWISADFISFPCRVIVFTSYWKSFKLYRVSHGKLGFLNQFWQIEYAS